jgi:protein-S-isoprenylcysteine O-methyltransferase Ste14
MILRHLLSILLLPFTAVIVVPYLLLRGTETHLPPRDDLWTVARICAGVVLFLGGLGLFVWSVELFARVGRGTLAPWDPTRNLVAVGPYRHVRNPMISGVALMLFGEALFWSSTAVGLWAGGFLIINHVYFILAEEPGLKQRFGDAYRNYKAHVPRWIPRARPWTGG